MENLLHDIPNVVVYINDILMSGATEDEYLKKLDQVLEKFEQAGLRLKQCKCELLTSSVVYLGNRIDQHGLHPTKQRIRTVQKASEPRNLSELKSFVGFLN